MNKMSEEEIIMTQQDKKEARCTFVYDRDTKRTHRYQVKSSHGIVGSIYIPKSTDPIPDTLILEKHRDEKK